MPSDDNNDLVFESLKARLDEIERAIDAPNPNHSLLSAYFGSFQDAYDSFESSLTREQTTELARRLNGLIQKRDNKIGSPGALQQDKERNIIRPKRGWGKKKT